MKEDTFKSKHKYKTKFSSSKASKISETEGEKQKNLQTQVLLLRKDQYGSMKTNQEKERDRLSTSETKESSLPILWSSKE